MEVAVVVEDVVVGVADKKSDVTLKLKTKCNNKNET